MGRPGHSIPTLIKWFYNRLVPTLLACLAIAGLWVLGQQAERSAYDWLTWISAKPVTNSPVTLVLIDNESLARLRSRFGPIPWSRKTWLDVFSRVQAQNPALMVFDGYFADVNGPEDTEVFTAMRQFPNLVVGLVRMQERQNTRLPEYYRLSLGVVSVPEEEDGVIRRLQPVCPLQQGRWDANLVPSLSLAATEMYLNRHTPYRIKTETATNWLSAQNVFRKQPTRLQLLPQGPAGRRLNVPMSADNGFFLHWAQPINRNSNEYQYSHTAIPLWKFFDNANAPPALKGRIALIGASASFYRDYHQTPVARRHLGPDIHATAIDNMLRGESIHKAGDVHNLAILSLLCLGVMLLRLRTRGFGQTLLYTLGGMIIYGWLVFWLLSEKGWWLDLVTPVLFMVVAFLAGSTFRIIFKERELAAMERNLSQLVDPEVFREIQRMSHVLKPGGHKLEITSMFVDIRNFTTLAERLQPAEVTELLNEFYSDIVNVVFSHHGTVDKFMGDGILIIFGAPLPNPEHRLAAVQAAHDILQATMALSRHWQETKDITTDIGISVNSGAAFVGFLGPADKLEYTGVGDTVNICVRLQEHTKQFHTRLILSEDTVTGVRDALKDKIPPEDYVELGEVSVRGRESTLKIYTLRQALLDQ